MSASVCVRDHISRTTCRYLYHIFCACCLWPWLGPPVAGWHNPMGNFGGFLPHWQCIVWAI